MRKRMNFGNVISIALGMTVGAIIGVAIAVTSRSFDVLSHSKSVEWIAAVGGWAGAIATTVAIYYAVTSGQRAIQAANALQEREHALGKSLRDEQRSAEHRKLMARDRFLAVAYRDELPAVIVKAVELIHMLSDQRFANYLELAFKYAARHPTPFLDRYGFDHGAVSEGLADVFLLAAVKVNRVRDFASGNFPVISSWGPEARSYMAGQLIFHLENARTVVESAYITACNLAGDDQGYPVDLLRSEGDKAFADRVARDERAALEANDSDATQPGDNHQ